MRTVQRLFIILILLISFQPNASAQLYWEPTPLNISGDSIGGLIIGEIMSFAVDSTNDLLFIGGDFHTVNGQPVCNVISWDGTSWDSLPGLAHDTTGIRDQVKHLKLYKGDLYAAGNIRLENDTNFYQLAMWTGAAWQAVPGFDLSGSNSPNQLVIEDMEVYNNELYIVGIFDSLPGHKTKGIARWNGTNWNTVGSATLPTAFSYILSLKVVNNELYVGGVEVIANQQIAKWNGLQWDSVSLSKSAFEGVSLISSYRERIYATDFPFGDFLVLNGKQLDTLSSPYTVNGKHPGVVVTTEVFQDQLFIGGLIGYPGGTDTWGVASWNDTTWMEYGSGIEGNVNAFAIYKDELYVGGGFKEVDTMRIRNLVKLTDTSTTNPPTALKNNPQAEQGLLLFPNPANTHATLVLGNNRNKNSSTVRLYTTCGKLLGEFVTQNNRLTLDLSDLAKGMYLVEYTSKNSHSTFQKLIKE
jgi:hypothetical protein